MNTKLMRASALFFAGMLALAGCSGQKGDTGPAGPAGSTGPTGPQGDPGADYVPPTVNGPGLLIQVTGATVNANKSVSVTYTVKDNAGTAMAGITPRFGLAQIAKDANGKMLPYVVLTKTGTLSQDTALPAPDPATVTANPTAVTPTTASTAAAMTGVIVDNGSGSYTYTFPAGGMTSAANATTGKTTYSVTRAVQVEPTSSSSYTIWLQASRQEDLTDTRTITPVNVEYDFVPAGGTAEKRQIASTDGCNACHGGFRKYTVENGFHGGGRINAGFCPICHNIERKSTLDDSLIPAADSGRFLHRIHYAEHLAKATSVFQKISDVTYPQDIRNCKACHQGALQGDQWNTRPNRSACGSCHDYVSFVSSTLPKCNDASADRSVGCLHPGGTMADDSHCADCHGPTDIQGYHVPVLPVDTDNSLAGGADTRTNAAQIAAAGVLPSFASRLEYVLDSVSAVNGHPSMKFKITRDGVDVVFKTYAAGSVTEPITDFVGTAGIYFAYASAQDGIAAPADFNKTASSNLRTLWNGGVQDRGSATSGTANGVTCTVAAPCDCTATVPCLPATSPGTLEADGTGYYIATLTGTTLPADARMLTGGLGYQYDLPNPTDFRNGIAKNQPLTQIDNTVGGSSTAFKAAYPYNADGTGGLIVPIADQWKTGTGFTARRTIVDNAKCNACHAFLGVAPSFHVGQRNNGPTCSFCHNPNRTSSGWSANASTFIHAIHGTDKRTVPYTWHATATSSFADVTFPGYLANCQTCHVAGAYDFSAPASAAAVPNLLWSSVATGTINPTDVAASPYVTTGVDYGTAGAATNLLTSPIMAACVSCHDTDTARGHMMGQGGSFYRTRADAKEASGRLAPEGCLLCHGPGAEWAIAKMHW